MSSFIWFQICFTEILDIYTVLNFRPYTHGVYESAKTYILVNWESSCSFSKKGFIKLISRKSVSYPAIIYYALHAISKIICILQYVIP